MTDNTEISLFFFYPVWDYCLWSSSSQVSGTASKISGGQKNPDSQRFLAGLFSFAWIALFVGVCAYGSEHGLSTLVSRTVVRIRFPKGKEEKQDYKPKSDLWSCGSLSLFCFQSVLFEVWSIHSKNSRRLLSTMSPGAHTYEASRKGKTRGLPLMWAECTWSLPGCAAIVGIGEQPCDTQRHR